MNQVKTKKRTRDEAISNEIKVVPAAEVQVDEPMETPEVPVVESKAPKEKTAAQLARKKRKKQTQQARRTGE